MSGAAAMCLCVGASIPSDSGEGQLCRSPVMKLMIRKQGLKRHRNVCMVVSPHTQSAAEEVMNTILLDV